MEYKELLEKIEKIESEGRTLVKPKYREKYLKMCEEMEPWDRGMVAIWISDNHTRTLRWAVRLMADRGVDPEEMLEKAIDDRREFKEDECYLPDEYDELLDRYLDLEIDEQEEVCILIAYHGEKLGDAVKEVEENGVQCRIGRFADGEGAAMELVYEHGWYGVEANDPVLDFIDWEAMAEAQDCNGEVHSWDPDDGGNEIYFITRDWS